MGKLAQIQSGKNVRFFLLFIYYFVLERKRRFPSTHTMHELLQRVRQRYGVGVPALGRWHCFRESVHGVIVGWANRVTHIRPWQHAELLELPNGGHTETVDDIHIIQCLWEREKKGKLSQFRILFLVKRYVVTTPHVSCHLLETIKPPLSNLLSLRRGFN